MPIDKLTDTAIMAALGRQMTAAVARESVVASNLANIDTPGYRAREVAFDTALDRQLSADTLQRTASNHLGGPSPSGPTVRDAVGLTSRRDGNNVQLDRELISLTRAAGDFSAAQTALAAKFRLIRYALNESR